MALAIGSSLTKRDFRRFQEVILKSFTQNENKMLRFLYRARWINAVMGFDPESDIGPDVILDASDGTEEIMRGGQRVAEKLFKNGWLWFDPEGDGGEGYFWLTEEAAQFFTILRDDLEAAMEGEESEEET